MQRDLESQLVVGTTSPDLIQRICDERTQLTNYMEQVTDETWEREDRKLKGFWSWSHGGWIGPASHLVRKYM